VIAARTAQALGIPWHSPDAAAIATNKLLLRARLRDAGLPVPPFRRFSLSHQPSAIGDQPLPPSFPCVVKPIALSGSRGVMRANDPRELATAVDRLRALMQSSEVRAERNDAHDTALIEEFVPGREYAIEGLIDDGVLHILAIFDKPDPLDGPFFEETIYVTPSRASADQQRAITETVARAAAAIGLRHGPIHAECRVNAHGVFVLEIAPRPIGGLCARALTFAPIDNQSSIINHQSSIPFEELLLRHALGDDPARYRRAADAAGVMMIPIPRRGIYRGVDGVDAARGVPNIVDVRITAKPDQLLVPLPEGASYLGFIFSRGARPADAERALRDAHARLSFHVAPEFPVLANASINYNHEHG